MAIAAAGEPVVDERTSEKPFELTGVRVFDFAFAVSFRA